MWPVSSPKRCALPPRVVQAVQQGALWKLKDPAARMQTGLSARQRGQLGPVRRGQTRSHQARPPQGGQVQTQPGLETRDQERLFSSCIHPGTWWSQGPAELPPPGSGEPCSTEVLLLVLHTLADGKSTQTQCSHAGCTICCLQPTSTVNATTTSSSNSSCKGSEQLLKTPANPICWSAPAAQGEEPLSPPPFPKACLLAQAEASHG